MLYLLINIGAYTDPGIVEIARKEMAEAYHLDEGQIDSAAYMLARERHDRREGIGTQMVVGPLGGVANGINQFEQG